MVSSDLKDQSKYFDFAKLNTRVGKVPPAKFMKIVFVTSASTQSSGGDGRVARELAHTLSKSANVLLILSGKKTGVSKKEARFVQFEVSGKEKGDIILPFLNPVKISSLVRVLREFSPDIVHFHDQGPVSFVVLLWALKNKVPVIFTCHTIPSEVISFGLADLFPKIQFLFDSKMFDNYFDIFLKKSSAIVAINNSVLKDLANFTFQTPTYKIPNGRCLSLYSEVPVADIASSPKHLLYVGYLTKRKNQNYLLDVMKYLPKGKFVLDLIGVPLNDSYGDELLEKARSLDLSVRFLGKISHEEIPGYLSQTHFFLSASTKEVQSLVIIEALASGTPIISLNNETTSEFVDSSVGCNFNASTSPEVFATKVRDFSELSAIAYKEMCANARKKVTGLDWSDIAIQTLAMYKEVLVSKDKTQRRLNGLKKLLKYIDISA